MKRGVELPYRAQTRVWARDVRTAATGQNGFVEVCDTDLW